MAALPDAMKLSTLYNCSNEHARQTNELSKSWETREPLSTWVLSHVGDHSSAAFLGSRFVLTSQGRSLGSFITYSHSVAHVHHMQCVEIAEPVSNADHAESAWSSKRSQFLHTFLASGKDLISVLAFVEMHSLHCRNTAAGQPV